MEYIRTYPSNKIIGLWLLAFLLISGSIYFLIEIDKIRPKILTEKDLSEMITTEAETPLSFFDATASPMLQEASRALGLKTGTPTPESDVLVGCQLHPNCGGGIIGLKKSVCQNATCCQIGNQWLFYTDKEKCIKDQDTLKAQLQKQQLQYQQLINKSQTNNISPQPQSQTGSVNQEIQNQEIATTSSEN